MPDDHDLLDDLGPLRATDPARDLAGRGTLDGRASGELAALLADGDEFAARRRISRRVVVPGAAAAAVAVLLTGTLGGSQIAALRGGDTPAISLFGPAGGPGTGASTTGDSEAASQSRMQAVLDRYRAARAKATAPYLLGLTTDPFQLGELPTDPAERDAVLRRAFSRVLIEPRWVGYWDSYLDARDSCAIVLAGPSPCVGVPLPLPTGPLPAGRSIAPAGTSTATTMDLPTTVGRVTVPGRTFPVGTSGGAVTIPDVPPTAIVSLARQDPTTPPARVRGPYDATSRTLALTVTEDEPATRGEYAMDVREEDDAVVVSIRVVKRSEPASPASATSMPNGFARQTRTVNLPRVELKAPLGGRPILDAATGTWLDREDAVAGQDPTGIPTAG